MAKGVTIPLSGINRLSVQILGGGVSQPWGPTPSHSTELQPVPRPDLQSATATLSGAGGQPGGVAVRTHNHVQGGRAAGIHQTTAKEL